MSDYKSDLPVDLRGEEYAAAYLTAAYGESPEAFLLALRDVVEARQGMGKTAARAGVNRESLYRMLSEKGNPRLKNLRALMEAIRFRVTFEPLKIEARDRKRTTRPG